MTEPRPLPEGTPYGWHTDPVDPTRNRWWDGTAWTRETSETVTPREFTTAEYLTAIGQEVRKIRGGVNLLALVAVAQVVLFALWFTGVITIEFRPTRF